MTLVEFLTARLDENEERISALVFCAPVWPTADQLLTDIAVKRGILAEHAIVDPGEEWQHCRRCEDTWRHDAMRAPCPTLRILASVYSDHADYNPEWAVLAGEQEQVQ